MAPVMLALAIICQPSIRPPKWQYLSSSVSVRVPTEDARRQTRFSAAAAAKYLNAGNEAWVESKKCVSCHTTGPYLYTHARLAAVVDLEVSNEIREFFIRELGQLEGKEGDDHIKTASGPAQVALIAAALATWDRYVDKNQETSHATDTAIRLALASQSRVSTAGNGRKFQPATCCPPFQADSYSVALTVAHAVGTAPNWLAKAMNDRGPTYLDDDDSGSGKSDKTALSTRLSLLKQYLVTETPVHDHAKVMKLIVASEWPEIMKDREKSDILNMIVRHQRSDGGWCARDFVRDNSVWTPEGVVVEVKNRQSGGYMTGMAATALLLHHAKSSESNRGLEWLMENQRRDGWWWTQSITRDPHRFLVYTGSCYAYLALGLGGKLP